MGEIFVSGLMALVMIITTIQDVLYKKINIWIICLGMVFLCICLPFCYNVNLLDRGLGFMLGTIVIGISKATRGKIGMGDGLILCFTGVGLGFWGNLQLFALSLTIAAIVSIIMLMFRWADRKTSIPFIPFLLLGYIIYLVEERMV